MPTQYVIPKIDPKVFKHKRTQVTENRAQQVFDETLTLPVIVGAKAPPEIEQGIELYYQNIPFPRKGFPDPDIFVSLNLVKKNTLTWLMGIAAKDNLLPFLGFALTPWKYKMRSINNFLFHFCRQNNYYVDFWKYEHKYYCPFAHELFHLIYSFLRALRVDTQVAYDTAELFAMFMEHDDRYRLPPQDLLSSTSADELLNHPYRELKRLYKLLAEREKVPFTVKRIGTVIKLIGVLLYLPKFRRAFRVAIQSVDFTKLQYDEGDRYWAYNWANYDSLGLPFEERIKLRDAYHKDQPPPIFIKRTPYEPTV